MITKKQLIIRKYLLMVKQLKKILHVDIFPEFTNVIDILFYFQYSFMMCNHPPEKIEDLLEINNIKLDDNTFGDVSEIILDFIFLLQSI
jgi:hypothetical protein